MAEAFAAIGFLLVGLTLATGGAPLLIFAAWLEARWKERQTLAEARLIEAKNEAKRLALHPSTKETGE